MMRCRGRLGLTDEQLPPISGVLVWGTQLFALGVLVHDTDDKSFEYRLSHVDGDGNTWERHSEETERMKCRGKTGEERGGRDPELQASSYIWDMRNVVLAMCGVRIGVNSNQAVNVGVEG